MAAQTPPEPALIAELVRHLNCPNCLVWWDFQPPRWLGEPWTREQADRLMRDHSRLVHPELIDGWAEQFKADRAAFEPGPTDAHIDGGGHGA